MRPGAAPAARWMRTTWKPRPHIARGIVHSCTPRLLDDGPTRFVVPLADVQRVERRKDRFWNGALIGYGIGFATGATMVLATPCKTDPNAFIDLCFDGPAFAAAFGGLITGPVGFAIGGITDAIKRKPRVVFDRGVSDRVAIAVGPILVRRGSGLRVAIAF